MDGKEFIYCGKAQCGKGICKSFKTEYEQQGRLYGVGRCGGHMVRRPFGDHELPGSI